MENFRRIRLIKRVEAAVSVMALVALTASVANWMVHGWAWALPSLTAICLSAASIMVSVTAGQVAKTLEGMREK